MPGSGGINFTVTGVAALDRKFRDLPKKLQNKILRDEIKAAAGPMHATAKALAPVDEGNLQRAIKIRAMKRKRGFVGRSIIVDPKRLAPDQAEGMRKYVAGLFAEYGTQHAEEHPYMRPAYEAKADSTKAQAIRNISRRIEQEAKS